MSIDLSHLKTWLKLSNEVPAAATKVKTSYEHLIVDESDGILTVKFNRPKTFNAFNMQMWVEYESVFENIGSNRVVVVEGAGAHFSSGMDLNVFAMMQKLSSEFTCEGRKREMLGRLIGKWQQAVSAPERCPIPVIAKIHGFCLGGAVDVITACDLRYCDASAEFSIKEIDLAIVADIGTLQRLPKLIGEQASKEMAFTGRHVDGEEAQANQIVLKCFATKENLDEQVAKIAAQIATKSPLTIRGIKTSINYARDHSTTDGLNQVAALNSATMFSSDLKVAMKAMLIKQPPLFEK